jgi:hypothetical protein
MIFGFNTDIKHEDTVYHVQSEAHEGEMLLQTQVFVRGRCIGKRATTYGETSGKRSTDHEKEQRLREQHRLVLDAIRDGRLERVFDKPDTPETLSTIQELEIHWLNSDSVHSEDKLSMKLRATEGGRAVAGARFTVRLARTNADPLYTQVIADGAGEAELVFLVEEASLPDSSILVQVNSGGRTATRKFQPRRLRA